MEQGIHHAELLPGTTARWHEMATPSTEKIMSSEPTLLIAIEIDVDSEPVPADPWQ